ncbi:MAG TPA: tetratricopeptide repeat protein, partial [Pseudonocardiaceae bacterium]|nr:tetratricopeptide repeat protein [Pseudonocardiaceae bacterium]
MEQEKPLTAGELPESEQEVRRLMEAGRLAEANVLFDKVVAHLPLTVDQFVRASVLVNRAVLAWRLGRIPLALELAAEGWTDLGSPTAEGPAAAQTFGRLGYLLEGMGNRRGALETLRASVRLARDAGDPAILAGSLQNLGGTLNFRAVELPEE